MGSAIQREQDEQPRLEAMISIKSLGLTAASSMTSIGAVLFDPTGKTDPHLRPENQLYVPVSQIDSSMFGFGSEQITLEWIQRNSDRGSPLPPEINTADTPVRHACQQLCEFLKRNDPARIWSNRPKFHVTYFEGVCRKVGLNFTFDHRKCPCYGSIMDVAYPDRNDRPPHDPERVGFPEQHALGDALTQVNNLIEVLQHYQPLPKKNYNGEPAPRKPGRRI